MTGRATGPGQPAEGHLTSLERWVVGYADDLMLRPVLWSLAGHAVVVVAPLLLAIWRTGSVVAAGVTLLLLVVSGWLAVAEVRHRGLGGLTLSLVGSWVGGAAFAVVCEWTGVI